MPMNDAYDPSLLTALEKGLDQIGPECSALLRAALPAIQRAISRGVSSSAIRRQISRTSGLRLTPEQFHRLLEGADDEKEERGALITDFLRLPRPSPLSRFPHVSHNTPVLPR